LLEAVQVETGLVQEVVLVVYAAQLVQLVVVVHLKALFL
jgi:hypothetical protein